MAHTASEFDLQTPSSTIFHIITRQKSPQIIFTFQKIPEPCPAYGISRPPPYNFMRRLKDFPPNLQDLIVVVSTAAPDVGLISRSKTPLTTDLPEDKITNVFTTTTMANDARRAQLPMAEDFTDTSAIGVALDLSSKEKVKRPLPGEDMDESPGPLPGLMVLNNEGVLCFWWLVYADSIRKGQNYPGLTLQALQDQGLHRAAAQQEPAFGGVSSALIPTLSQPSLGGTTASAGNFGNVFNKPAASAFGGANTPGPSGFGTSSVLGKQLSPWGTNVPSNAATHSASPAFGQPAFNQPVFGQPTFGSSQPVFGSSSTIGANAQGAAFGMTGSIGIRASPWVTSSSGTSSGLFGQLGSLGAQSGNAFASGPTGNTFGSGASAAPSSGPFSSFAKAPGFAAAAAQSGTEGGFGTDTTGSVFCSGMDTDSSFGGMPKKAEEVSRGLKNDGFIFESSFKGDGTAAKDSPKPTNDVSNSFFGGSFGDSLGNPQKTVPTPPAQEEEMNDNLTDDEKSSPGCPIVQEPTTESTATTTSKLQPPAEIPPRDSILGTPSQSRVTSISAESSARAISTFGKPTPITTTPKESPRKAVEVPRPSIETTPTPVMKKEPGDEEYAVLKGPPTPAPELSLPPESTSKASYTAGDTSSSSKSSIEDAPLPPDFLPSKSKLGISKESPQSIPIPLALDDDDEGSGIDVAQEISPITDPNQSPKTTPWSSFGTGPGKSPPGSVFTKVPRQQTQQNKPLFGEVGQNSVPYLPQPPKMQESPRSPSPVRALLTGDGLRPVNNRSISAPGQSSKTVANSKIASDRSAVKNPIPPSREDHQKHTRDRLMAQKAQESSEEDQELSDREDERVHEELATEVEATKILEPFVAHQDYVGTVSKPGVPGQIETVYRDINSMIDTLGFNARSMTAFIKGHSELHHDGSRSRNDLEAEDWCLFEIEDLRAIESHLGEQLEKGRMTAVQDKMNECRELRQVLNKIRSNRYEISNVVDAKSAPKQMEVRNSDSLNKNQKFVQRHLRKEFSDIQKHIADAENVISMLRVNLASHETSIRKNQMKKPTVEAVTSTITKMTSMVEKRNLDIDNLETQMRRLRFPSAKPDGRELSPFSGSLASAKKSFSSRKSVLNTQGDPDHISDNLSSRSRRSLGENGSPRKGLGSVTSESAEKYRLKVEQRKSVNEMVKKAILSSGPRLKSLS